MIDFNVFWYKTKGVLSKMFRWHRNLCYDVQIKFKIDDYVMFWIFFGFGVFTTLLLQWVF